MINIELGCKLPVCFGLGSCGVNMVTQDLVKHNMCLPYRIFSVLQLSTCNKRKMTLIYTQDALQCASGMAHACMCGDTEQKEACFLGPEIQRG